MMKQMLEGMFQRMDQNADGKLTLDEFSSFRERMGRQRSENAEQSEAEREAREARRVEREAQSEAAREAREAQREERQARAEANREAREARREETNSAEGSPDDQLAQRFNRIDSDENGEVSLDEFVSAMSRNRGNRSP